MKETMGLFTHQKNLNCTIQTSPQLSTLIDVKEVNWLNKQLIFSNFLKKLTKEKDEDLKIIVV